MKSYDLVIIGSGPGGYVAALYASRHKLSVCVVEKDLLGGTCLNRGCIPTKALLYSASILSKIKESKEYGIEAGGFKINFPAIAARKDAVVNRLRAGIETLFRGSRIELLKGAAKVVGADTVSVNGDILNAKSIIIATGSRPMSIPGIESDEVDICSSDGILKIKELPKSIGIVGGGVIGCEFASLFNALGSKVFIVELLDRILTTQSKEVSRKMEAIFKKRGVSIHTAAKLESITKENSLKLKISGGNVIEAEKALISVGRISNTEGIGLEGLGIQTEKGRILVDENLRTSVKSIYAIGDCVRGPLLAHKASYDGMAAVDNILGKTRTIDYAGVPNCVWTDPEVASVGLTEEEAFLKYPDIKIAKFPYLASGKAYLMGRPEGFIKIAGDSKGNIIGVEILGEEACDLIGEAVLAKSIGINIKDWANIVHGHPTLSEIFQEAAHVFCGTPIHSI
ncbi:MAG: dihydrolipoyl dehydrogenase [Omnitrophica bacterium RIFCSPLOWO2_01_FULL_45_24]|nr:MAG: dihydrolipoyl dehydrogenase [Omnitrophica bacterium RIFCSPLOWO2_01_FULL_45_24]